MNYEEFYAELQPQEKTVKDSLAAMQKLIKGMEKETETGDIKSLARDLEAVTAAAVSLSEKLAGIKNTVESFDTKEYFEGGEFTAQLLDSCREKGVDVSGEFPVYEMFPYKVKVDAENQELYLDRKKVQCMRPSSFAETVRKGQEKLNKAPFKPETFLKELGDAYDLAVLKLNKRAGADIYLSSLYKFLAPMSRFRKDYDQQSYAFDLARLYAKQMELEGGRAFQFGPCRQSNKSIRILDQNGKEQYLSTICFYD